MEDRCCSQIPVVIKCFLLLPCPRSDVSADTKWSKDFSALSDTGITFPPVTLGGINQAMIDSIAKVLQEGKTPEEAASWLCDAVNASLMENGELSE